MTGSPTVSVYDENVVNPNTVNFVATGSSLSNTDFTNQVASAFAQDMGGVIDGEELGQLYSYGASQGKGAHDRACERDQLGHRERLPHLQDQARLCHVGRRPPNTR